MDTPDSEPKVEDAEEMIIDTSHMNDDKASALEIAEAAREIQPKHPSFAGELFMGTFGIDAMLPFPTQNKEDAEIGEKLIIEVTHYLRSHVDPDVIDETGVIPDSVVADLGKMKLFAMKIPKEYGGLGLSQINYNRVMMAISSYCGSTAVLVSAHQSIGLPQPLKMFGTEEQKAKYLPQMAQGKISAFALTEPGVGSDPAQMKTTATLNAEGTHYLISGEKLWCTNGPIADFIVVMAQTEPVEIHGKMRKQITAFIVEKDFGGIETKHHCDFMGIRGIQNGLMVFNNVKVPVENIIAGKGKGLKIALATLNTGRLTLPAACTGAGKSCVSFVRRWGNKRIQWGAPIGRMEAGSEKISFIASTTFAMEAVTFLTSAWADDHSKDIRIEAAMAKLFCSERCWEVVDTTMQFRGGRGYERAASLKARGEDPYPIERMMREVRINRIIEGTSDIMKLFLAREAMDPHLKVAADILRKHSPANKKIKAGVQLAAFYTKWYPSQWVNKSLWNSHTDKGKLSKHFHYVESTSHKLARTIFHNIGLYQEQLENKQMILSRLMDIGTELFAISATCSYASSLHEKSDKDMTPLYLADVFCLDAEERISKLFDSLSDNFDRKKIKLSDSILDDDVSWLEEGILYCPDADET